jgi:hypothetical protein
MGRLSTTNEAKENSDMKKFKLKTLHNAEDKEHYQILKTQICSSGKNPMTSQLGYILRRIPKLE